MYVIEPHICVVCIIIDGIDEIGETTNHYEILARKEARTALRKVEEEAKIERVRTREPKKASDTGKKL
jgi:hypothetical protein